MSRKFLFVSLFIVSVFLAACASVAPAPGIPIISTVIPPTSTPIPTAEAVKDEPPGIKIINCEDVLDPSQWVNVGKEYPLIIFEKGKEYKATIRHDSKNNWHLEAPGYRLDNGYMDPGVYQFNNPEGVYDITLGCDTIFVQK